jgi:hypothetical protein
MKKIILLSAAFMFAAWAQATLVVGWTNGVNGVNFANGGFVPDNNASGWSDSRVITAPAGTIQNLSVALNLTGGWNGDLYAYLVNSVGGFAVLLDRVGYSGTGNGFGTAGMNITLTTGQTSIENVAVPTPLGLYSPDISYAGSLNSFLNPAGTWSLFISDLGAGEVTEVQSWGLQMDIVAVPEVETWIAAALAGAFGAFWLNRSIWGAARPD